MLCYATVGFKVLDFIAEAMFTDYRLCAVPKERERERERVAILTPGRERERESILNGGPQLGSKRTKGK